MARQLWTAELRNARDTTEQIAVLRAIKNDVMGYPLKKEIAVTQGILEPLVRLITSRLGNRQDGKSHDHRFAAKPLVEEEIVRLYGLHIIASLAQGGPSFLPFLNSASALPAILSNLCPSKNPPQVVLASLRALLNLASSASLASSPTLYASNTTAIADSLFVRQHLSSFTQILSQTSSSSAVQSQINAAASLITKLCHEERYQHVIANSGVLDALATKLASFVVAEGLVIPGADILAARDGLHEHFPLPAPQNASLSVILEALATIIADSKLRAAQLLYSPSILAVFPTGQSTDYIASQKTRLSWQGASLNNKNAQLNALDFLLPFVPLHNQKSASPQPTAFPPLGTSGSRDGLALNGRASSSKHNGASLPTWSDSTESGNLAPDGSVDVEEPESPLIAYLICILRAKRGMERLMAASVLTILYRTGLTNKTRETSIGVLVVPLILDLLHHKLEPKQSETDSQANDEALIEERTIKEKGPAVLAMLITDNEYLQKAAFDAHAISRLGDMLKVSYFPVLGSSNSRPWCPFPEETSDFSDSGISPKLIHNIKVRESVLKAIASIVPFKDEYRKAVVDEGMMPYIVESMRSEPGKPTKSTDKSEKTDVLKDEETPTGYGVNPVSVIIAACGAIRALSRSVSILRTTLIDNGIAPPVVELLRHPDIEIQIAATATMCNLVTDISPMREMIIEAGVISILCEHAHSMNARLRLNAVWALKHFVNAVTNDLKRKCVEELGQGWLVQLICDDTEDEALLSSREVSDKGVKDEDTDEDVEMDHFEEQVDAAFAGSFGRSINARPTSSHSKSIEQAEFRLAALRDAETNPARKARKDDIAVQEQGLSFIRNLIGPTGPGAGSEVTEMVDFLFSSLGQERFFEILASKLRPKIINPYNRRSSETRVQPPQPEIINAVTMILVHLAASVPRHRQIVIAQTELLKLLVPQFHHPNIEIRLALCHLATNLAWMDDSSDSKACMQRVKELQNLDFLSKLEMLERDNELNVRERAKSAVWQMKQSLGY